MGDRADFFQSNVLLSASLWHAIGLEQLRVSGRVCNVDGFVNISPIGRNQEKKKKPFAVFNMSP